MAISLETLPSSVVIRNFLITEFSSNLESLNIFFMCSLIVGIERQTQSLTSKLYSLITAIGWKTDYSLFESGKFVLNRNSVLYLDSK